MSAPVNRSENILPVSRDPTIKRRTTHPDEIPEADHIAGKKDPVTEAGLGMPFAPVILVPPVTTENVRTGTAKEYSVEGDIIAGTYRDSYYKKVLLANVETIAMARAMEYRGNKHPPERVVCL